MSSTLGSKIRHVASFEDSIEVELLRFFFFVGNALCNILWMHKLQNLEEEDDKEEKQQKKRKKKKKKKQTKVM